MMQKQIGSLFILVIGMFMLFVSPAQASTTPWWSFQAIDTMKYSRDPSREFLSNPTKFQTVVHEQVNQIASTGATHIGIATPYDEEFVPLLKEWVGASRAAGLKIWFRGNWSGWEGWFGYADISREQHLEKTVAFILNHPELFEDGDVFSACPECENGGPGDPRMNGDADGHRAFLIAEHRAMQAAFKTIGKDVQTNFNSMNGDVARLIMDEETTAALGGLVVVDHYVQTPEQLNADIHDFARRSGGKVVLGEFGAPIPDINGKMTTAEQAEWLSDTLELLARNEDLVGLSYWTNIGGSTAIWENNGQEKPAVAVLRKYYQPKAAVGKVVNRLGEPLSAVEFKTRDATFVTSADGRYSFPYLDPFEIEISSPGYQTRLISTDELSESNRLILERSVPSLWFSLKARFLKWFVK